MPATSMVEYRVSGILASGVVPPAGGKNKFALQVSIVTQSYSFAISGPVTRVTSAARQLCQWLTVNGLMENQNDAWFGCSV